MNFEHHDWVKMRGKDFEILALNALKWGIYVKDEKEINKIVGAYLSAKAAT